MTNGPLIPQTSVEFQTITTQPAFGNLEESDVTWFEYKDKDGNICTNPIKALQAQTRDWRFGYLRSKVHDLNFQWHYLDFANKLLLLRNGRFKRAHVAATMVVAAISETSQSHDGFFRRNTQSIYQEQTQTYLDKSPNPGFLSKMFGGNNRGGS